MPGSLVDVLVILAPGQGAQTAGFLTPWLADPRFADQLGWLGTVAGLDLIEYGTEADDDTIRDTKIAQPLLVGTGLAAASLLAEDGADPLLPSAIAGHSVGELTAAAHIGALSLEQAMVLVRERGNAMAQAAAIEPTGMTAVLGGDRDEVLAAIASRGLTAANDNGPGQIVAAGTTTALAEFAAAPPPKAKLRPLSVAGAFHTSTCNRLSHTSQRCRVPSRWLPPEPRSSRTPTAPWSPMDARSWTGSSVRSPAPSGGTCVWPPWPTPA